MGATAVALAPSRERLQHDEIEQIETIQAGVKAYRVVDQLQRLAARGRLGEKDEAPFLVAAAEKYAQWAHAACLEPRPQSAALNRVDNGGQSDGDPMNVLSVKDIGLTIIRSADKAMGPTQSSAVRAVVVEAWSPTAWSHKHGYERPEVGLAFLVDGLRLLRKHWGL